VTVQAPAGRAVDVWAADARETAVSAADLATLSEAETTRAAAFAFDADRRRYQAAHVMLRDVLAGYTGGRPATLAFGNDPCPACGRPSGRPVLAGGGPAFSLAHSGDIIVAAVACQRVGADVEQLPTRCMCSLMEEMHPGEAAAVAGLAEPERHHAIIRWWVRAEALLKCSGTGIAHGMDQVTVLAGAPAGYGLAEFPAPPGFLGAVALAGTGEVDVTVRYWARPARHAGR
jgi:4'-phosphopantetheinyl transferase